MQKLTTIKGNALLLNFFGIFIGVILYLLVYKLAWDVQVPNISLKHRLFIIPIFTVVMIAFVYMHEGIHLLAAMIFIKSKQVSIRWRWLVCECRVHTYLSRNQFVVYGLAPAILMGILTVIAYYATASSVVKYFAAVLFIASVASGGGDFWFIGRMLMLPKHVLVLDHGSEMEVFTTDGELISETERQA
ncbi:DUF3267 domain-containing protein [candidate division KSB1 bacterium]|nr:DUF3267 domain-containing protein [candidate division KSB1 bacterium]